MTFKLPDEVMEHNNILLIGLGGGADVVNTMPLYAYLRAHGKTVTLGACHGRHMNHIQGGYPITRWSKWVDFNCVKDKSSDRVFEPSLSKQVYEIFPDENKGGHHIAFISRKGESEGVAHALDIIAEDTGSTLIIAIDGGGDCLYTDDHGKNSGVSHQGDDLVVEALAGVVRAKTMVGIVAIGIDTPPDWKDVLKAVKDRNGYIYKGNMLGLDKDVLVKAMKAMRACLRFSSKEKDKDESLTATTFFCSLAKYYKTINTLTSWCPYITPNRQHGYLRLLDARELEYVKATFKTTRQARGYYNPYKNSENGWDFLKDHKSNGEKTQKIKQIEVKKG